MRLLVLVCTLGVGCLDYTITGEREEAEEGASDDSLPGDGGAAEELPDDTGEAPDEEIAEAPVYANTSTELFEVEPSTGERTLVGAFDDGQAPVEGMVDIAIDLDGRMYGATYDAVFRINPADARVNKVCDADIAMYAMTFTADGALIAGADDKVVVFDLEHCRTDDVVQSSGYETSGDLVGLPDGYLYWTVRGDGADGLVRVDLRGGETRFVGRVGAEKLFGLGYDDERLFGFSKNGETVSISPADASTTVLRVDDEISWWGATTNPVSWDW